MSTEDTTTISEEALRRQNVEAAFGRGATIECCAVPDGEWVESTHHRGARFRWDIFNYRVKGTDAAPRRTKAQLLDQIHELLVELRQLDGDA